MCRSRQRRRSDVVFRIDDDAPVASLERAFRWVNGNQAVTNVGSIFSAYTAAVGHTSTTQAKTDASATGASTNTDKPAAPGSSVKDWVDVFGSLPAAKSGEVRNQYLGSLQVPTTQLDLYTDDDD